MLGLFLSHGAPNRILSDSPAQMFIKSLALRYQKPSAIVIISAHWQTRYLSMTRAGVLTSFNDFYGFEKKLYKKTYQAEQPLDLQTKLVRHFTAHHYEPELIDRGLDHGAWTLLYSMYPDGDVPVICVSLPEYRGMQAYIDLGKVLSSLGDDIMVIGSGSATHNLSLLSHRQDTPQWSKAFVSWLQENVKEGDLEALSEMYQHAPYAQLAHPTIEHYLPLLIMAGFGHQMKAKLIHDSYELGCLNNSCFEFSL